MRIFALISCLLLTVGTATAQRLPDLAEYNDYVDEVTDYLYARELRVSDIYLSQMRSEDIDGLPHLVDRRPVNYEAILTERLPQ